jgi:hypothetical protein
MSMIGKLRQVSEFELAKFKSDPSVMVRVMSGSRRVGDPQAYAELRQNLEQSPVVQELMELSRQGKVPTKEQQLAMRQQMMDLLKQAQGMQRTAFGKSAPPPSDAPQSGPAELDLHKSWHCLHYLFTGKVDGSDGTPLGDAILGGTEIGGEAADTGYGPPRALSPSRVKNVAEALNAFPIAEKAKQFDPDAADRAEVYVAQHGAEELQHYFTELRNFYNDAASKGNAVLLWIE